MGAPGVTVMSPQALRPSGGSAARRPALGQRFVFRRAARKGAKLRRPDEPALSVGFTDGIDMHAIPPCGYTGAESTASTGDVVRLRLQLRQQLEGVAQCNGRCGSAARKRS